MKLSPIFCLLGIQVFGSAVAFASSPKETASARWNSNGSGISMVQAVQATSSIDSKVPGTTIYAVKATDSTRSLFDSDCLIMTEPADFDQLDIGDIVVYWHAGSQSIVVHRILERRNGGYWTKGDKKSRIEDELITRQNYRGRLFGVIYTKGQNFASGYGNG